MEFIAARLCTGMFSTKFLLTKAEEGWFLELRYKSSWLQPLVGVVIP